MPDQNLISLILLFPILAFIICKFLSNSNIHLAGWFYTACISFGLIFSIILYYQNIILPKKEIELTWFGIGQKKYNFSLLLDNYTYLMLILVHFIGLLIGIFSIEYMKRDVAKNRYFSFIGLFIFSMIGIILSGNLFQMYFFWELVGFSSYLLIGFWYDKPAAINASLKAFLINRIGDACFLLGIFLCYNNFGTTDIQHLHNNLNLKQNSTLVGLLLFGGCVAKSAQFPLHTWLPDAMEGPTPVSALIHAATMVAAGIYLIIRIFPVFTPDALTVVTTIGGISMLMGGVKAIFQSDIKKVLAYSTISQLGLMVVAVGIGAPDLAFFHLLTHAFFKAGLFLCAGSVIHAIHHANHGTDAQNMYLMGGLKSKLPVTFWCYAICAGSLAALPLFSGFLSKDQILEASYHLNGFGGKLIFISLLISSFLTAFYMSRQLWLVFGDKFRNSEVVLDHISENSSFILIPILILAVLSTQLISFIVPAPVLSLNVISAISTVVVLLGIGLAYILKGRLIHFKVYYSIFDLFYDKFIVKNTLNLTDKVYYFDKYFIDGVSKLSVNITMNFANISAWADHNIVDGIANGVAKISNKIGKSAQNLQSGQFQWYVSIMMLILLLIFTFWGRFLN